MCTVGKQTSSWGYKPQKHASRAGSQDVYTYKLQECSYIFNVVKLYIIQMQNVSLQFSTVHTYNMIILIAWIFVHYQSVDPTIFPCRMPSPKVSSWKKTYPIGGAHHGSCNAICLTILIRFFFMESYESHRSWWYIQVRTNKWPNCDRIGSFHHIHHSPSLQNHPRVCIIHWCSLSPSWTLSVLSRMVRAARGNWKLGTTCTLHHYTMKEKQLFSSNFLYGCPHLGDLQDSAKNMEFHHIFTFRLLAMQTKYS